MFPKKERITKGLVLNEHIFLCAISHDGRVIVGNVKNNQDDHCAFVYAQEQGVLDLGTLRSDNTGSSVAYGISSDGKVIVGVAASHNDHEHAFIYTQESGMVDLGTLRSDNTGLSGTYVFLQDGLVALGCADPDAGEKRLFFIV